ncbi:hypothetical protein CDD80_3395 [Ophiocordyceps camponoti-rufipedis]|uniref:BAR domain-containing protein n=1 Tax=Ophiocordyceps camponoti-rufipedis TaxID=2004952 RepID=A0A2C5ZJA5_9HYPO|nr:hypothetical protein CDD80_3395 [Ophiocordyceps camponoti-rufipedis]
MNFTKTIDRARQWAGEKMGGEVTRTAQSDEFQTLQAEMAMRQAGMESLQKSTAVYVKWASRRCDSSEDKARSAPLAAVGRSMTAHGAELEPESEWASGLAAVGRANERISDLHTSYADDVTTDWLHHLERSVTMMKEYQAARRKLESRRLAYDASIAKLQKSKRDDFRVEDEMRVCKTKFEDSTEDVLRRMQDIKDAEVDDVVALTSFLDAELNFHERAVEELRRARHNLTGAGDTSHSSMTRSRSRNAAPERPQMAKRPTSAQVLPAPLPAKQPVKRASTFGNKTPTATRVPVLPRNATDATPDSGDDSSGSEGASPSWGNRSASSETSHDSIAKIKSANGLKKAGPPPPPPVNRAKKPPPPPVPARKANLGY